MISRRERIYVGIIVCVVAPLIVLVLDFFVVLGVFSLVFRLMLISPEPIIVLLILPLTALWFCFMVGLVVAAASPFYGVAILLGKFELVEGVS